MECLGVRWTTDNMYLHATLEALVVVLQSRLKASKAAELLLAAPGGLEDLEEL
jgi:hypothetical protein